MFFEGSEKKIEAVFSRRDLRSLGDDYWKVVVESCNATILSKISSKSVDAYLLSESSLFVWDDYILMITCGRTILINAIKKLVNDFGQDNFKSLIFQRKNEYIERLQETSFEEDANELNKIFGGSCKAFQLGFLDDHHNFLFHLDRPFNPPTEDRTCELLMYHLDDSASAFFQKYQTVDDVRSFLQLNKIFSDWQFDDHSFSPVGYSLNALKGDRYITMHITPQEGSSYVSFETNLDTATKHRNLIENFIKILRPGSFDLITFNHSLKPELAEHYLLSHAAYEHLKCGYEINFSVYNKSQTGIRSGIKLELKK